MILNIVGLPNHFSYGDIKAMIKREARIYNFVLDNLSLDSSGRKTVTVGLADGSESPILISRLNGFTIAGQSLSIFPNDASQRRGIPVQSYGISNTGRNCGPSYPRSNAAIQEPPQQFQNKSQAGWYSTGGLLQTPTNREFMTKTELKSSHGVPLRSHSPPRGQYPTSSKMECPSRNYGTALSLRPQFQDQAATSRHFTGGSHPSDEQPYPRDKSRWNTAPVQEQYRVQTLDVPVAPLARERSPYSGGSLDRRRSRTPPRGGDRIGDSVGGDWRRGHGLRVSPERNLPPWQANRRQSSSPSRGRHPSPEPWTRSSPKAGPHEHPATAGPARQSSFQGGPPKWSELPSKDYIPSRFASTSPTRGVRGSDLRPYPGHPTRQEDSDPYFSNRGAGKREIHHQHEVHHTDVPPRDRADDFGGYRARGESITGERDMQDFRSRDFESQGGPRGYSARDGEPHFEPQDYDRDFAQRHDINPQPFDSRAGRPDFQIRAEGARNNKSRDFSVPHARSGESRRPADTASRPEPYGIGAPSRRLSPERCDFQRKTEGDWTQQRNTSPERYPPVERNNGQSAETRDRFVPEPQTHGFDDIRKSEMAVRDQWVESTSRKMLTRFNPRIEPNSELYIDVEKELKKELLDRVDSIFGIEYGHTLNQIGLAYCQQYKVLLDWNLMRKLTAKCATESDNRKRPAEVGVLPPAKKPREVEPTPLPVQRIAPVAALPPAKKPREEPTPVPVQRVAPVVTAAAPPPAQIIISSPVPRVQVPMRKSKNVSGGDDLMQPDTLLFSRAIGSILTTEVTKRLYIIKPDLSIISAVEGNLIKRFFLEEILKATSNKDFKPSFVIVGLQKENMFEVTAENEKSRKWLIKHNMNTFKAFSLLVYTFEELTYERATIWLPGHINLPLKPLEKLRLQNRYMEGIALEKWKLVKTTTSPDGTRIFVDIDKSSSAALTQHNMELNYELEKVYVVLKCMSTDRGEFDAVFQQKSIPRDGKKPVVNVPSLQTKLTKDSIRISVEDQKMTTEIAVSLKLKIIKKMYEHLQNKDINISFSNHGLQTEPSFFVLNPDNNETILWLLSLDLGKFHGNRKVIVEKGLFLPKSMKVGLMLPGEVGQYGPSVLQKFNGSNSIIGVDFTKWRLVAQMVNKEGTGSKVAIDVDFDSMIALKKLKYTLKYENKTVVLKHNHHGLLTSADETEAGTDHHIVTDMDLDSDTEDVSTNDTENSNADIHDSIKEGFSEKHENVENTANDNDDDVMICESGPPEVVTIDSDDDDDEIVNMKKELEGIFKSINNEIEKRQTKDPVGRDAMLRSKYKKPIDAVEWKYEGKFSAMSDGDLEYYHNLITEIQVPNNLVSAEKLNKLSSLLESIQNKILN